MMVPDKVFVEELENISPRLSVEWGEILKLWVIWYKSPDGSRYKIHEVKNPDGTYRSLDNRVLDMLKRCDMSRYVDDPGYQFSEHYRKVKQEKAKIIEKNKEERAYRSKQLASKWNVAIDNAKYKNIFNDGQVWSPKPFSFIKLTSRKLIQKLGKPQITGVPSIINP